MECKLFYDHLSKYNIGQESNVDLTPLQGIKQGNRNSLRRQLAEKISNEMEWITFLETIHNGL